MGGRPGTLRRVVAQNANLNPELLKLDDLHDTLRKGLMCTDDFFAEINKRYPAPKPLTRKAYLREADYVKIENRADVVYDLVSRLRAIGIRTAILSNVYKLSANILRERGRYEGFDPVLLSYEEQMAKPDPEFFSLAVKKLDVRPEEIIFIDDQAKNLPPAVNMGMHVVRAVSPDQIVRDVKKIVSRENKLQLA